MSKNENQNTFETTLFSYKSYNKVFESIRMYKNVYKMNRREEINKVLKRLVSR